jgi:hypothetical protein
MLHVTNGDVAVQRIASLELPCDVLPWQDVLHDGPVPGGLSAEELRCARADFLARAFGLSFDDVLLGLQQRDARLGRAIRSEEILLWFEPDLYDQLQLLQVLAACEAADVRVALQLVPLHTHFGFAADATLREAYESRYPVSPDDRELASSAWGCFRSKDPRSFEASARDAPAALPYVAPAIRRSLEEFPCSSRGLARSEAQLLEAIAGEAETAAEAFRVSANREEHVFLGDASFAGYLRRLGAGDRPLVRFADGRPISAADPADVKSRFWHAPVQLTSEGRAVLAGQLDRAEVLPFDHWIGGVHLEGTKPVWRRDAAGHIFRVS